MGRKKPNELLPPIDLVNRLYGDKKDEQPPPKEKKKRVYQRFDAKGFARFIYRTDPVCFFLTPIEIKSRLNGQLHASEETIEKFMADDEFKKMKEGYRASLPDKFWAIMSHWTELSLKSNQPSGKIIEVLGGATNQYVKGKTSQENVTEAMKEKLIEAVKKVKEKK